jgi:endo-1,4-beta-xylanase
MRIRSALTALTALTVTVALTSASAAPAIAAQSPTDLRELAKRTGVTLASAVDVAALGGEADYRTVLNREFSGVTAENAMKWESVEPQRGVFDWSGADAVVAGARANHQIVRGHTLVWHSQLPTWLTDGVNAGTISDAGLRTILRDHIMTEVGRYRGTVRAWDVVNEVLNEDGTLRQTIWLDHLGPGYIADAFRWAHQADPQAKLYYNDFNLESIGPKSDAALALVKQLKADRVPIDGVGFQGHLAIQFGFPGDLADNMRRFIAAGVETALTEVDVRMPLPVTPEKQATQAAFYRDTFDACVRVRHCVGYTVWGFTDRHSWIPGFFAGEGSACLFDENLATKPAYDALLEVRR